MQRVQKILEHINASLEAIGKLEKNMISRNSLLEFGELIWEAYKNCEAAIFLLKIEMRAVDEYDDSKLVFDQDYPDYNIIVAEEHIRKAVTLVEKNGLRQALNELRTARNILAELFVRSRKEKIDRIKASFKQKKFNI
jgi:hypothetical protein